MIINPSSRDQGFRRAVVTAYDHRCALCGIRMLTADGHTAVVTSPQLTTNPNVPGHLLTLNGRGMIGPAEQPLWPDVEALSWHGRQIFRRR